MAEMAVTFVLDQLLPLLNNEANLLKSVHKEFADIKDELESIQGFLKDADRRAAAGGDNINEGVKTWVKQVREAAFRIEDIIDDYMVHVGRQPRDPGCAALLCKIAHLIKSLIPRHRIAYEIHDIKSSVREIKERSERYCFQIQPSFGEGSSSSRGNQNAKWYDPRMASLYMEESQVVGFEAPRDRLIGWLVKGKKERTVISVVGMGGQGKTTLAKKVFDSKEVIGHFDCRVWITVSQSYTVEALLRDMLSKFYKQGGECPPQDIHEMDRGSLIDAMRNCLHQKRYVVVFDDVWNIHFWDEIEFALIDVKNGSRIFITTRNMDVAISCKKSSFVEVHELEPLSDEHALELFNKKVFRFEFDGRCPKELNDISFEIVKKCNGLPLAIVAIGGLLSTKEEKNTVVWRKFSENLNSELRSDSHLIGITEILGFSYHDLSSYLKSCLLYFGIYPEDYEVKPKRLIRQWIAERFVKEERGKTLEEVAEGYLTELIHRSLVQVSSISIDGRAEGCRVHDLLRVMILKKFEDLSFCQHISEDGRSSLSGRIRRLSIATTSNDLMTSVESPRVRSLLFFADKELPDYIVRRITKKYKLLKVLDFQDTLFDHIPENLGNLLHLKYLSLKNSGYKSLPKSIGMLQNLDLRGTRVSEMPKETKKLRKLRHLLGDQLSLNQLEDGIGGMTSLQTLWDIDLDGDAMGKLIRELGKLKQLRKLGLVGVRGEHGMFLSSSINEMQHLEKLYISSELTLFLPSNSSTPMLRNLTLYGELKQQMLPEWISGLQNLVELDLRRSKLTDDPLKSLQNLQNLLSLSITYHAYVGVRLHFQDGGFQKLRELCLDHLPVSSIIIDKGALHSLKNLDLGRMSHIKTVPTGIRYLEKLEVLSIVFMPTEFMESISARGGKAHWVVENVPRVTIDKTDIKFLEL